MTKIRKVWDEYRLKCSGFVEYTGEGLYQPRLLRDFNKLYRFDNQRSSLEYLGMIHDVYDINGQGKTYRIVFYESDLSNLSVDRDEKLWVFRGEDGTRS